MHFDDRLATVLRSRGGSASMARIQYRQLLDLLGTMPVEAEGPQIDAACDRLGELGGVIPARERSAMLREPGVRLRNIRLVSLLAAGEPSLAAAAIEAANLSEEEWIDLAPALPPAARSLVGQRSNIGPRAAALFRQLGMVPPGLPATEVAASEHVAVSEPARSDDIAAIVQRIEDFRKTREPVDGSEGAQAAQARTDTERALARLKAFDFATDAEGCIVWSDPGMAPMAVGLRLASHDMTGPASARAILALALRHRQPLRALRMELSGAPAIAGRWQIDAAPCFEPGTGAYIGHAGRMRRQAESAMPRQSAAPDSDTDRMRQLLHELRTPVNAIQGFAEVIQQQLFGPAPHEYRALAANVAGDAARVLAGLEELERLARLEGGRMTLEADGCDLAEVLESAVRQLRAFTEPRGGGFTQNLAERADLQVALGHADCERLIWRILATLAGAAAPGESLKLRARGRDLSVQLTVALPQSLAALDDELLWQALAASGSKALSAGIFGAGFSLRLARAEAAAAGGELRRKDKRLKLTLPGLTADQPGHSEGQENAARA